MNKMTTSDDATQKEDVDMSEKTSLRQRLKHFTWAWFLTTMSTGGLAIAVAETPHRFRGEWMCVWWVSWEV
jgi:hypothetical protein